MQANHIKQPTKQGSFVPPLHRLRPPSPTGREGREGGMIQKVALNLLKIGYV